MVHHGRRRGQTKKQAHPNWAGEAQISDWPRPDSKTVIEPRQMGKFEQKHTHHALAKSRFCKSDGKAVQQTLNLNIEGRLKHNARLWRLGAIPLIGILKDVFSIMLGYGVLGQHPQPEYCRTSLA